MAMRRIHLAVGTCLGLSRPGAAMADAYSAGMPWETAADRWARILGSQWVQAPVVFLAVCLFLSGVWYFEQPFARQVAKGAGLFLFILGIGMKVLF
jgi:hypothetical protein